MTKKPAASQPDRFCLPPGPKLHWFALLLLAGMGALFFTSYAWSNWLASERVDTPSIYFAWERHIPFIPWTILPYWSIDFFYAASFFLWSTRAALLMHAKRLLAAQLLSVACFLAFPLHFAFERPTVHGWAATLFTLLGGFDKPFNQAPSLHISLLVILWVAYAARVHGAWRWLLHVWFGLIGASVLTTYQHHFFDVPAGLLAGCLCVFAFPLSGPKGRVVRHQHSRRMASCYGMGATAVALLSLIIFRDAPAAGLLLAWTALVLACVARQYHAGRPDGLGKQADGTFPLTSCCLLAPYMCGVFVNSRCWTRGQPGASRVAEGLWLGRFPTTAELRRTGADAVLDLTAELPRLIRPSVYRCMPVLDLTVPRLEDLRVAVDTIRAWQADGHTVLVCCALGYARSALVAAAWLADQYPELVESGQLLAHLRAVRPGVVLGPGSIEVLTAYVSTKRAHTDERHARGVDNAL